MLHSLISCQLELDNSKCLTLIKADSFYLKNFPKMLNFSILTPNPITMISLKSCCSYWLVRPGRLKIGR